MRECGCFPATILAQPHRPCRPHHPYAVPRTFLQYVCTRRRNCIEQLSTCPKYGPEVGSFPARNSAPIELLRAIRRRGRSGHLAVLAQPVQGLMLTEAAQFEMADFKDRCRNFCGKSTSHEQWPANILAEEFQPAEDVDVAPDGGEVEAIARANIAVCGITIVQSNIDGNMLLNLGR